MRSGEQATACEVLCTCDALRGMNPLSLSSVTVGVGDIGNAQRHELHQH